MPERKMPQILRIVRTRATPGQEAELERVLSEALKSRLAGVDGVVAWYKGRPINYDSSEYVVVTVWRDKDALRAFAGASMPAPTIRDDEPAEEVSTEQFELFGSSDGLAIGPAGSENRPRPQAWLIVPSNVRTPRRSGLMEVTDNEGT